MKMKPLLTSTLIGIMMTYIMIFIFDSVIGYPASDVVTVIIALITGSSCQLVAYQMLKSK